MIGGKQQVVEQIYNKDGIITSFYCPVCEKYKTNSQVYLMNECYGCNDCFELSEDIIDIQKALKEGLILCIIRMVKKKFIIKELKWKYLPVSVIRGVENDQES